MLPDKQQFRSYSPLYHSLNRLLWLIFALLLNTPNTSYVTKHYTVGAFVDRLQNTSENHRHSCLPTNLSSVAIIVTGYFGSCEGNWGEHQILTNRWTQTGPPHEIIVEVGYLTKLEASRVNRDQVMDLEISFEIHTNVSYYAGDSFPQNHIECEHVVLSNYKIQF